MPTETDESPTDESPTDETRPTDTDASADGRRDIVVPMRLYKTITVFSTLIAVFCVVFGFVLLDAATLQMSVLRRVVTGVLGALGLGVDSGALDATLAALGLLVIGFGAWVYTLATRFRARGMGKPQEDSIEE